MAPQLGEPERGESDDERQRRIERARKAPMRARILDLYEQDMDRSLDPSVLLADLQGEFRGLSISHVQYHLGRLRKLGLIPSERQDGD